MRNRRAGAGLAPRAGPGLAAAAVVAVAVCWNASTRADPPTAETLALCKSCHGDQGLPINPAIPIISGQEFYYLYVQLKDYKAGRRANLIMSAIVEQLDKKQMQALAQHFSEQSWPATGFRALDSDTERGASAAVAGQCPQCHLGGYEGNSRIPRLAGQQLAYLERTMLEFKNKVRRNSPAKGSLMNAYPDGEITALARYLAGF